MDYSFACTLPLSVSRRETTTVSQCHRHGGSVWAEVRAVTVSPGPGARRPLMILAMLRLRRSKARGRVNFRRRTLPLALSVRARLSLCQ